MKISYSCHHRPESFELLTPNESFPMPKAGTTYLWHVVNFTPDQDKFKTILAFEKAFNIWQRAMDLVPPVGNYLSFASTDDIAQADIVISFGSHDHTAYFSNGTTEKCIAPFDGALSVLAHAWSLGYTPYRYAGHIHLDESESWADMHNFDKGMIHLLTVFGHELGHVLDLGHSKVKTAWLFPAYSGIITELDPDDQRAMDVRFGPLKQQIKESIPEPAPPAEDPPIEGPPCTINGTGDCTTEVDGIYNNKIVPWLIVLLFLLALLFTFV